jgi:hypothetical protein
MYVMSLSDFKKNSQDLHDIAEHLWDEKNLVKML